MKKFIALSVCFALMLQSMSFAKDNDNIRIIYEDKQVYGRIDSSRTMLGEDEIKELLDANIDVNSQSITLSAGDKNIVFNTESNLLNSGDKVFEMDCKPFYDGQAYLPIRYVAKALGLDIKWDEENKIVTLSSVDAVSSATVSGEHHDKPDAVSSATVSGEHHDKPDAVSSATVSGEHHDKPDAVSSATVSSEHHDKPDAVSSATPQKEQSPEALAESIVSLHNGDLTAEAYLDTVYERKFLTYILEEYTKNIPELTNLEDAFQYVTKTVKDEVKDFKITSDDLSFTKEELTDEEREYCLQELNNVYSSDEVTNIAKMTFTIKTENTDAFESHFIYELDGKWFFMF